MGGTAFLIHGQLPDEAVKAASRGGLLARLLGRSALSVTSMGKDTELLSLPPRDLKNMVDSFLEYLHRALPVPWPATVQELDYLKMASKIYLRGTRQHGTTGWYVQYSLSGCAGMAEVSAELGSHWLCKWYEAEANSIAQQFFTPIGFVPTQSDEDIADRLFLPIAGCGYAAFDGAVTSDQAAERGNFQFEVDCAVEETLGDNAETAMKQLEEVCGGFRRTGKCCCQLCQPNLDLGYMEKLTYFK